MEFTQGYIEQLNVSLATYPELITEYDNKLLWQIVGKINELVDVANTLQKEHESHEAYHRQVER